MVAKTLELRRAQPCQSHKFTKKVGIIDIGEKILAHSTGNPGAGQYTAQAHGTQDLTRASSIGRMKGPVQRSLTDMTLCSQSGNGHRLLLVMPQGLGNQRG